MAFEDFRGLEIRHINSRYGWHPTTHIFCLKFANIMLCYFSGTDERIRQSNQNDTWISNEAYWSIEQAGADVTLIGNKFKMFQLFVVHFYN